MAGGLLNHSKKSGQNKLVHSGPVKVENQVERGDVVTDENTVTFPTNVRVDNHIRNQITALNNIGIGSTQKEVVGNLLSERIEKLSDSDRQRFNRILNILEQKDYLTSLSKK